ncbi:MAG: Asp23/Gls24 family envelope stress response protein [Acidimicrobiia bacterium]
MAQTGTATATKERTGSSAKTGELQTDHGNTSVADSVVAKIAGIAAREVSGVHEMGAGAARAFGAIKEIVAGTAPAPTQGVAVAVGEKDASIDLDLVVEYGVSIPDVSRSVRNNVIQRVEGMTGLSVTEVNISVDDIYLEDDTDRATEN